MAFGFLIRLEDRKAVRLIVQLAVLGMVLWPATGRGQSDSQSTSTPTAQARKDYAAQLNGQVSTKNQWNTKLSITAEGPDSTYFTWHITKVEMTESMCNSLLVGDNRTELMGQGFTKVICTDDKNTRFTLDLVAQTNPVATQAPSAPTTQAPDAQTSATQAPAAASNQATTPTDINTLIDLAAQNYAKELEKKYANAADDLATIMGASPADNSGSAGAASGGGGTLSSKLGMDINSDEMKTWMAGLGTAQVDKFSTGDYYNYKPVGISLLFNPQNQLSSIFFYAEGADGFKEYKGDLPFGLTFKMTRKEIEDSLGMPDSAGGDGVINFWESYDSKGLGISYNTKKTGDMKAKMHDLSISAAK